MTPAYKSQINQPLKAREELFKELPMEIMKKDLSFSYL